MPPCICTVLERSWIQVSEQPGPGKQFPVTRAYYLIFLDICYRLILQIKLIVQVLVTEPNREPRVNRGRARRCDPSFFRSFREKELFQPVV